MIRPSRTRITFTPRTDFDSPGPKRHGNSTLIERQQELRNASAKSFNAATGQLIENFDAALVKFEADVRAGKANVRVTERTPSSAVGGGGGSFSGADALFLMLLAVAAATLRKQIIT